MSTFALPTEVWLTIATHMGRSEYRCLVSVCRNFHNIFTESLYSSVAFTFSDHTRFSYSGTKSKSQRHLRLHSVDANTSLLLKRLRTNPSLRQAVRHVHIKNLSSRDDFSRAYSWENDPEEPIYDAYVGAFVRTLGDLPLLQRVEVTNSYIHTKWLLYLAIHSMKNLDFDLRNASIYGEVEPITEVNPTKVTARTLVLQSNTYWDHFSTGLTHFLSSPSLNTLHIGTMSPTFLKAAFNLLGQPSLSHLKSLTVPYVNRDDISLLKALINLRELKFLGRSRLFDVGVHDIPLDILRKLEVISVHSTFVTTLTSGRNITSISTEGPLGRGDTILGSTEPHFGSNVMVTTVDWTRCVEWDELLDNLTAKNPGIHHLTIDPVNGPTSETALLPYLSKFAQFPELRTLKFPTLIHVPSERTLAWERKQCEYLRRIGSPSLVSISFSELISWARHPDDETLWRPSGIGMETAKLNLRFTEQQQGRGLVGRDDWHA